jgi:hypothetical protein
MGVNKTSNSPQIPSDATVKDAKPLLVNDFEISKDGHSATKEFSYGGNKLIIVVHFPKDASLHEKNKRLEKFDDKILHLMGSYAIDKGIGRDEKEKKSFVKALHFKQNSEGQFIGVTKEYGNGKIKKIDLDYYRERIHGVEKDATPEGKKKKETRERKLRTLEDIVKFWDTNFKDKTLLQQQAEDKRLQEETSKTPSKEPVDASQPLPDEEDDPLGNDPLEGQDKA